MVLMVNGLFKSINKVNILKDISDVEIDDSDFKEKNTYKGKWIILVIIFSIILLYEVTALLRLSQSNTSDFL